MSSWSLPTTVQICEKSLPIRSDFRAVLDALSALNSTELSQQEKIIAVLQILYPSWEQIPDLEEAFRAAMVFINLGKDIPENQASKPKLMDWQQDADLIAPAVDKVLGYSCRRCEYLHWWEFVGAYSNIGRGLFSEVVNIRNKRAKGKKLEKYEREFANENADLVNLEKPLDDEAEEFFKRLGV